MNVKEIDNVFLNPVFIVKLLILLREFDLLDDVSIRNALIRKEWIESKHKSEANKDFMERIAAKHNISVKTIDSILYGKGGKKKYLTPELKISNEKILKEMLEQN